MKRLANYFSAVAKASAFILAAMVVFSACEPQEQKVDPNVQVSQTEYTTEAAGGSVDVTVTTNVAWVAEVANQERWVTVSPAEGEAGENKVTITVKKNNSDNPRETKVSFKGETAVAEVTVKQFGKDNVSIDKSEYSATPAGGSDVVAVTSNTNWTATVSDGADWVTVAPSNGEAGETAATVTVAANETAEARNATVTFVAGEASVEYSVSQEALSVTLSQSNFAVAGEGGNTTVSVTANAAWTAASSADWVTVDPAAGETGATEVTVTVAENPVEEERTATVTFAINENVKVEFAVTQAFVEPTGEVVITVPSVTATKAELVLTPDPLTEFTYYWDIIDKATADILLPTDQEIIDYVVNDVNELLASNPDYTWADVIDEGVVNYTYTGLSPVTTYYAFAFGIDGNGNVTTKLFKTEFTTADLNPALKDWMGTWNVTSSQTYLRENGGQNGLFDTPTERTITIGTSSVFDLELEESDLVVSGISYTDGIPLFNGGLQLETVASVDERGNLLFKNGYETYNASGVGIFTWVGYCNIPAMQQFSIVTGSYAPYTLAFGADKTTATATPYSGILSSEEEFVVSYYDMFIQREAGGWSSYYSTPGYGILAGTWTLTKVEETTSAAPQSVNAKQFKTKIEKQMVVENVKLMKNFNSKIIYQSAQIR